MNTSLHKDKHTQPESNYPKSDKLLIPEENLGYIQAVLDSNPHISALINREKQVVLSNEHLVLLEGLGSLNDIIGERPGNLLKCINIEQGGSCTSTVNCQFCGINLAIQESQLYNRRISSECRITSRIGKRLISFDFHVTCSPIVLHNEPFTILNLIDISSEKRNEMLEKIFFHDILNRLGGFSGIVKVIKSENKQPELEEFIDVLNIIGELAIEDIQTQQYLRAAENANLILNIREYSAREILESVHKQILYHPAMSSRHVQVCSDCPDFILKTDGTLLKRILLNMAKNAAEATPENGSIRANFGTYSDRAVFSMHNPGAIPGPVRPQIFQRSFSTKGEGRGLGTYSMKLFGENYLRGKVFFTTDEKSGTLFTIELPLS
jgi:signal transduction histidine kinase